MTLQNRANTPFIQLNPEECKYLLDLIQDMDSDTVYTARQRSYTIPKLIGIVNGTFDRKLMYKDVLYLLELIDDDELTSSIKESAKSTLLKIKELQTERLDEYANIDEQRSKRRTKRVGLVSTKKTQDLK